MQDFALKMRAAESSSHEGKRRSESLWPILQLNHARSRYLYELFYKRKAITRTLYDWCLENGLADAELIAKWKKRGYERLCCLQCLGSGGRGTNFGTGCVCRVPKANLEEGVAVECVNCGCRGCSG